jgi:hypothetical protein
MDAYPVTEDEEVALLAYDAMIGSDFELVNLMPKSVLRELPTGWASRAFEKTCSLLRTIVPAAEDLLEPNLRRGELRDHAHAEWAYRLGIALRPGRSEIPPAG